MPSRLASLSRNQAARSPTPTDGSCPRLLQCRSRSASPERRPPRKPLPGAATRPRLLRCPRPPPHLRVSARGRARGLEQREPPLAALIQQAAEALLNLLAVEDTGD